MTIFDDVQGFQWDNGNFLKNWEKHSVSNSECEEMFFNQPIIVADDEKHSRTEKRHFALGKTNGGRRLFVVFTIRKDTIRVIYVDWEKAGKAIFPNLKPTLKTISLRLPEPMLNRLKILANERDVPYQSLLKIFLKERLDRELEK